MFIVIDRELNTAKDTIPVISSTKVNILDTEDLKVEQYDINELVVLQRTLGGIYGIQFGAERWSLPRLTLQYFESALNGRLKAKYGKYFFDNRAFLTIYASDKILLWGAYEDGTTVFTIRHNIEIDNCKTLFQWGEKLSSNSWHLMLALLLETEGRKFSVSIELILHENLKISVIKVDSDVGGFIAQLQINKRFVISDSEKSRLRLLGGI